MGPLGSRVRSACLGALAAFAGLALVSAGVRLLPWLFDPRVAWGAVWVFARGLLAVAAETSCAVSLPLGYALAAVAANDRGEARACMLMGATPLGLGARTWPLLLAIAVPAVVAGFVWGGQLAEPSRVLGELVSSASCGPARRVSDIPGTGAAWLCDDHGARLAIVSGSALATARAVRIAPGTFEADGVQVALRGPPEVRLHVEHATVSGLLAFEAPAGAAGGKRGLALIAAGALSALGLMSTLLASGESRRTVAAALGALGAASPLLVAGVLDRANAPAFAYVIVVLAGLVPCVGHAVWIELVRRRARARVAGLRSRWYALPRHGTHRPR